MKPSLLVITPRFPYPVIGGDRLRIYQQCKALSRHYRLTLLSLCETQEELRMPLPQDGVFETVERYSHPKWKAWFNTLLALPTRQPLQIAYYRSKILCQRIQALAPRHSAIFAHLIRTGDMVKHQPQIKFLEMTDAISLGYHRLRQNPPPLRDFMSWLYRFEYRRLKRYEQTIAQHFNRTFLISVVDRQFLFGADPNFVKRIGIVSNGVDMVEFPYQFGENDKDLIFIGNMSAVPNQDAVEYLVADILPLVAKTYPQVRLRVVGRISPAYRERLCRLPRVQVVGAVPSMAQATAGGGVGVCPMRLGAGVQNKLLEYMALGLPAVTTSIGLQGLQAKPGLEVALADDPEDFAAAICRLLQDQNQAARQAWAARQYVESQHNWASTLQPMLDSINAELNP